MYVVHVPANAAFGFQASITALSYRANLENCWCAIYLFHRLAMEADVGISCATAWPAQLVLAMHTLKFAVV